MELVTLPLFLFSRRLVRRVNTRVVLAICVNRDNISIDVQ